MLELAKLENAQIIQALEHDSNFFINFFLAEDIIVPVPEYQWDIMDLMVHSDVERLSLAVPRAHNKTTLAELAAIHYFLFSDYSYILYMSETSGHSVPCVNDIMGWMTCDNFVKVFGEIEFQTEQVGKGFFEFKMPNGKQCILKAFGAQQKVRGTKIRKKRPQLIIIDDLEDNGPKGNINTHEAFIALKRWVYGPFFKCVDPFMSKIIWIGNMVQSEQMLNEHQTDPDWHSVLYGCLLADGTALWPDLWSIQKLREDFARYQRNGMADVWFAEMMNMPMAGGNGIITAEDISYAPELQPRQYTIGFITIDLAISDKEWAHSTVIAVHIWDADIERWQITDIREFKGIGPIDLFYQVIEVGQLWGIGLVGIESVAYQAALQPVFEHLALIEYIEGFEFVPITARARKTERIVTWAGLVKKGYYVLTEGDFIITQQLLAYDPKKKENKDDVIDACAHGNKMIAEYSYEIFNMGTLEQSEPMDIQNSHEIARI